MKKIITALALSLLLVGFSPGFVHAETLVLPQDVNNILNELEEISDNIVDINIHTDSQDSLLEDAIEEVLELEEDAPSKLERLEEIYEKAQEKVKDIAKIVEKQYNGKKQFVINTKEVYKLSFELQENLSNVRSEMKDIIKDKDREIDVETYGEIRKTTDTLKKEIKENDYIIGEITKETRNYLRLVKNKKFKEAVKSFERILILQEQQIELLQIINKNVLKLEDILMNA